MRHTIGVAINACGWVAYEHAKAILRNPHTRLVGVTSRRADSAQRLVGSLGVDCRIYPDYEALLADAEVDAVAVTTPNYLHTPDAISACRAGKHVILEKPPAISHEQCDALVQAVRQSGVRSIVSFVLRWNPLVRNIRSLLDRGAIGEVFLAQTDYWHGAGSVISPDRWIARREFTGSAMLAGGSHAVDMMRYLVGREPVTAAAFSRPGLEGFDFDTTEAGLLAFEGGAIGRVSACLDMVGPYQFNIELMGDRGTVRDDRIWSRALFPGQTDFATIPCVLPNSGEVAHHPFQQEIDHFAECILEGRDCCPDIEDGVRTVRACLAMDEAAHAGRTVAVRR